MAGVDNIDWSKVTDDDRRYMYATHSHTPQQWLIELAQDESSEIRQRVASNASTPVHVLEMLAFDSDEDVRCGVVLNLNTPEHCLYEMTLAHQDSRRLLYALIENPNLPDTALDIICENPDRFSSKWARANRRVRQEGDLKALYRLYFSSLNRPPYWWDALIPLATYRQHEARKTQLPLFELA